MRIPGVSLRTWNAQAASSASRQSAAAPLERLVTILRLSRAARTMGDTAIAQGRGVWRAAPSGQANAVWVGRMPPGVAAAIWRAASATATVHWA